MMIPQADNLGNPLPGLTEAAHHYLVHGAPLEVHGTYVDPGKWGMWENRRERYDLLVTHAEDSPEADSYIKQLAAYIGELANQEIVLVTKQGKQLSTWPIRNSQYQVGMPSDMVK